MTYREHVDAAPQGYQILGAGVLGFDGVEIDAAGPGVLVPEKWNQQIRAIHGDFVVVESYSTGEQYTTSFKWHAREISPRFHYWADVQNWLKINGKLSEPGSGPNVWD